MNSLRRVSSGDKVWAYRFPPLSQNRAFSAVVQSVHTQGQPKAFRLSGGDFIFVLSEPETGTENGYCFVLTYHGTLYVSYGVLKCYTEDA
jgi:hypothetical protein